MAALAPFAVHRPASLGEAAALLAASGSRLLAGGTDLLPNLRRGIGRPEALISLDGVDSLRELVFVDDGSVSIGAGVTLARLAADRRFDGAWRAVREAAASVAGPQHRNAATVGGNLCLDTRCVYYNQSAWWRAANGYCLKLEGTVCHVAPQGQRCHAAFSGDLAPALIALAAEVVLFSATGRRRITVADLYREDGAAHLTLAEGEIIERIVLPNTPPRTVSAYRKVRVRRSMDFPLAGIAVALATVGTRIERLTVALTGTNPRPFAVVGLDAMTGRTVDDVTLDTLGKLVQRQVSPMRTSVTPSNYRRQVAAVESQRLVRELAMSVA